MLSHCILKAHSSRCSRVEWTVLSWNKRAKQVYESIGAVYPDDGVWEIMRMDRDAIEKFVQSSETT